MEYDVKFYDTSSLLLMSETLFEQEKKFVISSITLKELESIKNSSNKDIDIKHSARLLLHLLEKNIDKYIIVDHFKTSEDVIVAQGLEINNDTKILSDAIYCNNEFFVDRTVFVTNDLALKSIAGLFFGDKMIKSIPEEADNYTGYEEVNCGDGALAAFYQDMSINYFNLLPNQYLILRDFEDQVVDIKVWTGETHRDITYKTFESEYFGKIKPYEKDIYQTLLFDSLVNNQITMVRGSPGSGKTFVTLSFLMSQLERGRIDKILIFCNTIAADGAAKLGLKG